MAAAHTRSKRNSGTITGGTIHSEARKEDIGRSCNSIGGSVRNPQSPVDAAETCGDATPYASGTPIASANTPRMREFGAAASARMNGECAGYCPGIGACWSLQVGWAPAARRQACMTIRSRRETVTFRHPFRIRSIERLLPAGAYEVITDEEAIEGLTFSAYRRIATMIVVPSEGAHNSMEVLSIGSVDLADAQAADASAGDD